MSGDMLDDRLIPYVAKAACHRCSHRTGFRSCSAFPDETIPLPIWHGEDPHTSPVEGDQGITFEPKA